MNSTIDIPDIPLRIILSMLDCHTILYKLPLVSNNYISGIVKTIPMHLNIPTITEYKWDNAKLSTILNIICSKYNVIGIKIPWFWNIQTMSNILITFSNITHISLKYDEVFSVTWVCMIPLYNTICSILSRIKYLDVQNWIIPKKYTDEIFCNNQLQHLTLPNSMLDKNSLEKIGNCKYLTSLYIPYSKYIDDDIVKKISDRCTKLSKLIVCSNTITDQGIGYISSLPLINLQITPYYGKLISGVGIENIKTLKILKLCRSGITDTQLQKILQNCLNLQEIALPGSENITDEGFNVKIWSKYIMHLNLDECFHLTGQGISHISTRCKFRTLSLESIFKIKDRYLTSIFLHSPDLIYLSLIKCKISNHGIASLYKKCPYLEKLYLSDTLITTRYMSTIVENLPNLSVLCIDSVGITEETIPKLPTGLTQLHIDNTTIFYNDLCNIMERCPNIIYLSVENIDISSVEMYNFMTRYPTLEKVYVDVWIADTIYKLFSSIHRYNPDA